MGSRGGLQHEYARGHVLLGAFACVPCVGTWSHHFRVSAPQMSNTTGRQIRQRGARRMQDSGWSLASWNSPDRTGGRSVSVCVRVWFVPDRTGGIKLCFQLCLFCHPYLCHLWLQHQRLRTHPRYVYVDLTVTREKRAVKYTNIHMRKMHAHTHTPLNFHILHLRCETAATCTPDQIASILVSLCIFTATLLCSIKDMCWIYFQQFCP